LRKQVFFRMFQSYGYLFELLIRKPLIEYDCEAWHDRFWERDLSSPFTFILGVSTIDMQGLFQFIISVAFDHSSDGDLVSMLRLLGPWITVDLSLVIILTQTDLK
jgi:hypothetical protein